MKKHFRAVSIIMLIVFLSGCVSYTNVTVESNVDGAELFIDGRPEGPVPTNVRLSNGIWEDPDIRLEKDGYITQYTSLKKTIQPVNLAFGILGWWPAYLWCYGPDSYQYFRMVPESE